MLGQWANRRTYREKFTGEAHSPVPGGLGPPFRHRVSSGPGVDTCNTPVIKESRP